MRFSFRPERKAEDDLFGPLRELRSPISMEKLQSFVLARASGSFSFWSQVRGLLGQWIALGVISTIAINFTGFRGEIGGHNIPISNTSAAATRATPAKNAEFSNPGSYYDRQVNANSALPTIYNTLRATKRSSILSSKSIATISSITSLRSEEGTPILPQKNQINDFLQQTAITPNPSTGMAWFSTLSSGAVFSNIRMLGENAEIGIQSGWESIGLAITNANGNRDWHDVLEHHAMTSSLLFGENDQAIALMAGANFSVGPLECKAALGPAYLISSTTYINPATLTLGPSGITQRFGVAAEVSALYNVNDFFQAGVTTISSYRIGQFTSGVMISVNIRP